MRELFYDMVDLSNQIGRPATCVYWILVRTVPPPVSCESYGVCITMLQTGEREDIWSSFVTFNQKVVQVS